MTDLYLGLAIMTLLMGCAFGLAMIATRKAPKWALDGLAGLVVVAIAVYARWIWDDTFVADLLPYSNLIIISNWFPLAAGVLAGLTWRRIGDQPAKFLGLGSAEYGSTPRKVLSAGVLFVAGFVSMAWPLLGAPPRCDNDWQGDICLQTTGATCSAAAGATLLQNYGVYASEQEMAELCLTRRGTNWKGLYRGLSLKGREAGRKVEVTLWTAEDLVENPSEPVILQCELLMEDYSSDIRYDMSGWVRGQPHSVVLLDIYRKDELELFIVADPSLKDQVVEGWGRKDLETLWHGQVLRLIPMEGPAVNREE